LNRDQSRDKSVGNLNDRLDKLNKANGHNYNHNNNLEPDKEPNELNWDDGISFWRGKHFVRNAEWKTRAGFTDLTDVGLSREEWDTLETAVSNHDTAASERLHNLCKSLKHEINPEVLQWFPGEDPPITQIFNPFYKCSEAPTLYKEFREEYRALLTFKGFRSADYDGSFEDGAIENDDNPSLARRHRNEG
jgi:hypothetical protein